MFFKKSKISIFNFKKFILINKNKNNSIFYEDYLNGSIQRRNKHLVFKDNGDVLYDKTSKYPNYVEYNSIYLEMRELSKRDKKKYVSSYDYSILYCKMSLDVHVQLRMDGFRPYRIPENQFGHTYALALVCEKIWKVNN